MSTLAPPPAAVGSRSDAASEPYKFLDFFEERDAGTFAGRDRDIQECLERISTQRLFVLYARSGFGKTSLLKAGLFPRLRERGLRPVYVRTLQDPVRDLRAAIGAEAGASSRDDGAAEEPLAAMIRRLPSAGRVVLILDQFEEFFIRFRDRREARKAFLETLRALVNEPELDVHLVFSLREDYLAELDDVQATLPRLFERSYRLPPLTAFGAREAITRPLDRHGIEYSPTLVTRMVDQLDEVDLDPPLLQIFCTEVFRQATLRHDGKRVLTDDDVKAVGGLDGIFRRYLDAVTGAAVLKDNPLLARNVLDALLTQEDTKRAVTLDELTAGRFRATRGEIAPILSVLVDRYLVRRSIREDAEWYELIHERLVPFVKEWLDRDPGFLNFRLARDLITYTNRGQHWRTRSYLLLNAGQVGGVIKPFRDRLSLDRNEAEFVFTSAVMSRSEEAAYWAEQVGLGRSRELFLGFLGGEDRDFRLGAASGAGVMPDPTGEIARACKAFSSEPDEEIRRAAARSFTKLHERYGDVEIPSRAVERPAPVARPAGLALRRLNARLDRAMPVLHRVFRQLVVFSTGLVTLVRASRDSLRTRGVIGTARHIAQTFSGTRPDIDFLSVRAEAGDTLKDVPLWLRFYACTIASGRLQALQAKGIRRHATYGAVAGLVAGLLWSTLVAPVVIRFHESLTTDAPGWGLLPRDGTGWGIILAGIVSAGIVGFFATQAEARSTLIRGRGFHPFALARSRVLLAPLGYFVLDALNSWVQALEGPEANVFIQLHLSDAEFEALYSIFIAGLVISSPLWNRFLRILMGAGWAIEVGMYLLSHYDATGMLPRGAFANSVVHLLFIPLFLGALAAGIFVTGGLLHVVRRCVDESAAVPLEWSVGSCFAWVTPGCVGLPFLLLAAANLPVASLTGRWPDATGRLVLVMSYLAAVCVPARVQAWRASPLVLNRAEPAPPRSKAARRAVVASLYFLPIGFSLMWGFDSFPWGGRTYDVTDPGLHTVRVSAGPASPDVGYASIRARRPSIVYVKTARGPVGALRTRVVEGDERAVNRVESGDSLGVLNSGRWYWFPQGMIELMLRHEEEPPAGRAGGPAVEAVELGLERRELPSTQAVATPDSGVAPYALTFERASDGLWVGRLSGAWTEQDGFRPAIRLTDIAGVDFVTDAWQVDGAELAGFPAEAALKGAEGVAAGRFQAHPPLAPTPLDQDLGEPGAPKPVGRSIYPTVKAGRWDVRISGRFRLAETAAKLREITLIVNAGREAVPRPAAAAAIKPTPTPPPIPDSARARSDADRMASSMDSVTKNHQDRWRQVASLYQRARRAGEDDAKLHFQLSAALANRGDLGQAIEEGRIALELDPKDRRLANGLAWKLCLAGRFPEALPIAERATAGKGTPADHWDTLAHAAYGSGRWREAVEAWGRALESSPGYFDDPSHVNCGDDREHLETARRRMLDAMDAAFPRSPFARAR